ncbi:MAG: hypothetical protein ACRDOH_13410 [Streptosporangiaceae bacterium]
MSNTTTGSDRVVPGQQPPEEERGSRLARLTRPAVTHWQFAIVAAAAIVMRIIVILGYPPILWFNDSYNYVYDAVTHIPDEVRPNGYPFFIDLLLPLHSANPLAVLQAAMGVGMGVIIYALLRHRGLPWWGATLPTLPVLFDSYELHLEHMVTADTLFVFLVTVAIVILCWNDRPSVPVMAVAGLLIGYATLVRSVGEPLLAVVLVAMLARRAGWRRLVTLLIAGIVPIAAYMFWFDGTYGKYALTESSGTFLYGRVSTFAECAKIDPPADVRALCDPTPAYLRPVAGEYIWADNELWPDNHATTPLFKLNNSGDTSLRFTPQVSGMAEKFAKAAIFAQPFDYLRAVIRDTLHTFGWNRQPDPNNYYGNGPAFQFDVSAPQAPWWAGPVTTSQEPQWERLYKTDVPAHQMYQARQVFAGASLGDASAVRPWQRLLQIYQRYFYLRGTLLGLIVLIGAAGVLARWRRWGGIGLLPWMVGALLIVLPPMTAGFSYRYVLAAAPAVCLAAGLAFVPGDRSVRALAADLRRHFGRGVAVEQE